MSIDKLDLETEFTDLPVCPYCGDKLEDPCELFENYQEFTRVDCDSCEKEFEIERIITVEYSTYKIDHEKEKKEAEEKAQRKALRYAEVLKFPPGTRIKIIDGDTIYKGKIGIVANKEIRPLETHVTVNFPGPRKDYWYFPPEHIERI